MRKKALLKRRCDCRRSVCLFVQALDNTKGEEKILLSNTLRFTRTKTTSQLYDHDRYIVCTSTLIMIMIMIIIIIILFKNKIRYDEYRDQRLQHEEE
jgi:hypothetical protein